VSRLLTAELKWENERLELQHYMFLLTFNDRLHLSPLPAVMHHVLDAGCGTGDWAIDFGKPGKLSGPVTLC